MLIVPSGGYCTSAVYRAVCNHSGWSSRNPQRQRSAAEHHLRDGRNSVSLRTGRSELTDSWNGIRADRPRESKCRCALTSLANRLRQESTTAAVCELSGGPKRSVERLRHRGGLLPYIGRQFGLHRSTGRSSPVRRHRNALEFLL